MAAPSIPNLLGLRGSRGGGREGRGRRAGPGGGPALGPSPDAAVQGTDTDAAVSRLSSVELGYLDDRYARFFVTAPPTRRLPIINRGTYMRTKALDAMIDGFISHNGPSPKQIISLGAGTDTRPLHMFERPGADNIVYHEIDFEPTCRRKQFIVQSTPALRPIFNEFKTDNDGSWTAQPARGGKYRCHALDLRNMGNSMAELPSTIRSDIPTLLLSECCLCYLTQEDSVRLLSFFSSKIPDLAALLYEPMPLDDAFGKMMTSNLKARHIHMPSLERYRDHHGQLSRLREAGFERLGYATIENAWNSWVDDGERERVDALEGLDEVEEWKLLAAHYVVVWGSRGTGFGAFGDSVTPT